MKETSKPTWIPPMAATTVDRGDLLVGGRTAMTPGRLMKTCKTTDVSPHVARTAAPTPKATVTATGTAVGTARATETETTRVGTTLAPTARGRMATPSRDDRRRPTWPKMTPGDLLLLIHLLQKSQRAPPKEFSSLHVRHSQRNPIR